MAHESATIRTPDQRLRVFVSSTMKELEPERRAARAAIEAMHLAPVMFELGAHPHPPRELYRSYLAQSDVFVGIYWERYGWIAPEERISGLEDEYGLSDRLPRLIYIKDPAPGHEERLEALIDRIRSDDTTSYKSFRDEEELERLVENDLATLLAESFEAVRAPDTGRRDPPVIPAPYGPIVGRDGERLAIGELLGRPETRLVSLVGAGGIGKSRLAIEVALDAAAGGRAVAFALLEAATSPDLVITAIARALGVRDASTEGLAEDQVLAALSDRDVLLIVDNMEHVLEASDVLVRLVTGTSALQILVTSRSPLRVRAEHVFEVGPLEVPAADAPVAEAEASAAVELFALRAASVRRDFALSADTLSDVVAICRTLEGVPLAIELAAARSRSLTPREILTRLDSALALLVAGPRDLPERQRALRDTIGWSVDLLDADARAGLSVLSVFAGSFTLESAEAVLTAAGSADPLGCLDALIDASLVGRTQAKQFASFRLLSTVRAYASGLLAESERVRVTDAWTSHYRSLAAEAALGLRGTQQLEWLTRLDLEIENFGNVARTLLDQRQLEPAARFAWKLYLYLWIGGHMSSARAWMAELLETAEREALDLDDRTRAIALCYQHDLGFWQSAGWDSVPGLVASRDLFLRAGDPFGAAIAGVSLCLAHLARPGEPDVASAVAELDASLAGFRADRDVWGEAMTLVVRGRIALATHDIAAAGTCFDESLALARAEGEQLGIAIAQHNRGWAKFLGGDIEGGRQDFAAALERSFAISHDEGVANGLEAFAGLRASECDPAVAGRLLGAAQALRRRKGLLGPGLFDFSRAPLWALREQGFGVELDQATVEGEGLAVPDALAISRGEASSGQ